MKCQFGRDPVPLRAIPFPSAQLASSLGIKTNYDKWEDLSDAADVADLAISLQNLASLKHDFNYDALDPQTQQSWQLFDWPPASSVGKVFSGQEKASPPAPIAAKIFDNLHPPSAHVATFNAAGSRVT